MDKNKCPFLIFVLLFVLKKVKKLLLVTYGLNPFLRLKNYLAKLWSRFFGPFFGHFLGDYPKLALFSLF